MHRDVARRADRASAGRARARPEWSGRLHVEQDARSGAMRRASASRLVGGRARRRQWKPSSCARSRRMRGEAQVVLDDQDQRAPACQRWSRSSSTSARPRPAARPAAPRGRAPAPVRRRRWRDARRRAPAPRPGCGLRYVAAASSVKVLPCPGALLEPRCRRRAGARGRARSTGRGRCRRTCGCVLPSAWRNASKITSCWCSARCRCRCRARRRRRGRRRAAATCSATSPRSVNLSAFDSRFFRICSSRWRVGARCCAGAPGATSTREAPAASARASGSKVLRQRRRRCAPSGTGFGHARRPCRPRSSTGRGCR